MATPYSFADDFAYLQEVTPTTAMDDPDFQAHLNTLAAWIHVVRRPNRTIYDSTHTTPALDQKKRAKAIKA